MKELVLENFEKNRIDKIIKEEVGHIRLLSRKPLVTTVSDVMVETLVNWGIKYVFGMVGYSNLGLADAIRRHCEAGDLTYIGIRHEGALPKFIKAAGNQTQT